MSRTILRNATKVYEAGIRLAQQGSWVFTIRQLSEECGMSKPTVAKHMRLLIDEGICKEIGVSAARKTGIFQWIEGVNGD